MVRRIGRGRCQNAGSAWSGATTRNAVNGIRFAWRKSRTAGARTRPSSMPRKITFSVVSMRDTTGAIAGTGGAVAKGVVVTGAGALAGSGRRVGAGVVAPTATRSAWPSPNRVTTPTTSTAASTITSAV